MCAPCDRRPPTRTSGKRSRAPTRGLVAAAAAHPRLLEAALALRFAREAEGMQIAEAWRNIREFVAIGPRAHSPSLIGFVREAFPEFGAAVDDVERPLQYRAWR